MEHAPHVAHEEPRYVSHPIGNINSISDEDELRYVSYPTANISSVSGEDEPRYVSHPTGHTNSVSGEGEPRYVSHPAAHSNAVVFRRNTESNTDAYHVDIQHSASDTSHAVAHGWRSKATVMCVAVSVAVVVGVIMASSVCLGLALTDNKTHHEKIVYQLPVNDMVQTNQQSIAVTSCTACADGNYSKSSAGSSSQSSTSSQHTELITTSHSFTPSPLASYQHLHQFTTRLQSTTLSQHTEVVTTPPRSTPLPLASYQYSHQFTVPHLITASHGVTTLSVSHDGRLLIVAQYGQNKSYIYNTSGSYVSTIQVPGKHSIRDAVWAPHGDNIMITCEYGSSLWLVSATGTVISETGFVTPAELSVSPGGVIYLTHHRFGIFESKDDGKSWYSLIRQFDIVKYQHAIRVPVDEQSYDIWTIVRIDEARDSYRLRIYSLPSGSNKVPNRGRDLAVPNCRLEDFSRLAFDGHSHVYITESFGAGVHEWSVTSYHERQLLQTADSRRLSYRVTVDTRRHVLYVGQVSGIVSVFTRQ